MPSSSKMWILMSSLLAVVLAVGAWMMVMSPVRDESSKLNSDAKNVETTNEILATKVKNLSAQFAKIDDLRNQLKTYESQIPEAISYSQITSEVQRSVDDSGVALLSLQSEGGIAPVTPFTAIKVDPKSKDSNKPVKKEDIVTVSGLPPTKTGALSSDVEGFYQVPLTIRVQGSYDNVLKFADDLQVGSKRAILVYSVDVTALGEQAESDTAPEAQAGDLTLVLNAYAFVLDFDKSSLPTDESTAAPEKTMPKPATSNVFAPDRTQG